MSQVILRLTWKEIERQGGMCYWGTKCFNPPMEGGDCRWESQEEAPCHRVCVQWQLNEDALARRVKETVI